MKKAEERRVSGALLPCQPPPEPGRHRVLSVRCRDEVDLICEGAHERAVIAGSAGHLSKGRLRIPPDPAQDARVVSRWRPQGDAVRFSVEEEP